MKRVRAILVILVVLASFVYVPRVSQACVVTDFFNSILGSAPVSFVCNPTAEQQATADAMLKALDSAQAVGAMFYPALGLAQASSVLTVIKNGGCFLVAQLQEAFKAVDAANAAVAQAKTAKGLKMAVALPQYEPLRRYIQ